MPRLARTIEGGQIYHVLNRSNNKIRIFDTEGDYSAFERTLFEAKEKNPMNILAYCLMPNHWHFVMYPERDNDLARFMHWLTTTHTQRWLIYRDMIGYGHLYQSRYKSFPIQNDEHFLQVCRYVERNALRAKLVEKAEDWRWGSTWARGYGSLEHKRLLSDWPVPMPDGYQKLLNTNLLHDDDQLTNLRLSVNRGRPFGDLNWIETISAKLNLTSTLKSRGRPKKGTGPKKGTVPFL